MLYKVTVDQPMNIFLQQYIVDNCYLNCYYDDFIIDMMTLIIVIIMSTGLTWAETGLNGPRLIINENKAPNEKKVGLQS